MLLVCRLTWLLCLLNWRSRQVSSWASGRISWAHRGWLRLSLELQPRRQLRRTVMKKHDQNVIKIKCCSWSLMYLMTCCCTVVSSGKSLCTCIQILWSSTTFRYLLKFLRPFYTSILSPFTGRYCTVLLLYLTAEKNGFFKKSFNLYNQVVKLYA